MSFPWSYGRVTSITQLSFIQSTGASYLIWFSILTKIGYSFGFELIFFIKINFHFAFSVFQKFKDLAVDRAGIEPALKSGLAHASNAVTDP